MEDLDRLFTLPIFGYKDYDSYLHDASCKRLLYNVKVPVFYLNAEDDPIIITGSYPIKEMKTNPNILIGSTVCGGHIGYLTGL